MTLASAIVAEQHTLDSIPDTRTFMESNVREVTSDGIVVMTSGVEVVLWGLNLNAGPELENFLTGHRIQCRVLDRRDNAVFADCKLSPTDIRPPFSTDYLDLFVWLPRFGLAEQVCGAGGFGDVYSLWEQGQGTISYGCPRNIPERGGILQQ